MLVERADFADLRELALHRQHLWEKQREYVLARSPLHQRVWSNTEPPSGAKGSRPSPWPAHQGE
jgi:phenylacetate-CoA ligase